MYRWHLYVRGVNKTTFEAHKGTQLYSRYLNAIRKDTSLFMNSLPLSVSKPSIQSSGGRNNPVSYGSRACNPLVYVPPLLVGIALLRVGFWLAQLVEDKQGAEYVLLSSIGLVALFGGILSFASVPGWCQ
jgi:hypothetical protein